MKKTNHILMLSIAVSLVLTSSCNDDCSEAEKVPESVIFTFRDEFGNNLIGSKYDPDTIKTLNSDLLIAFTNGRKSIRLYYHFVRSESNINLYLNASDSDTVSFSYSRQEGACGVNYPITGVTYNSQTIDLKDDNDYIIIK